MFNNLPPLNSLLAFEAAARLNSFKLAAEELHQTPAAIAYQIKKLEQALNRPLFIRHHQGVTLNHIGTAYLEHVRSMLNQLDRQTKSIRNQHQGQHLKILTLHAIAEKWLMPRLEPFRQQHPGITIQIQASETLKDSAAYDLVIGFQTRPVTDPFKQAFITEQIFPVCSPAYVARFQSQPTALSEMELLLDAHWQGEWQRWLDVNQLDTPLNLGSGLNFSLYSMVIDAAIKGMGVMMGHQLLIETELQQKSLQPVFDNTKSITGYYYLQTTVFDSSNSAADKFVEWLQQQHKLQDD